MGLSNAGQLLSRDSSGRFSKRTGIAIIIEGKGLTAFDDRMASLTRMDLNDVLESVGAVVESQTRRRIQEEKRDPVTGIEWADWSENYAGSLHGSSPKHKHPGQLRKSGRHSILQLDGALLDSIMYQVHGGNVTIGSNLIYARVHQLGYEEIPARPYLGLSDENREEIEGVVLDFIREVFV